MATALTVFPYALRLVNCIATSDSPLLFDRELESHSLDYQLMANTSLMPASGADEDTRRDRRHPDDQLATQLAFIRRQRSTSQPPAEPVDHYRRQHGDGMALRAGGSG